MQDIYAATPKTKQHSLRYIHIIARDVIGILNRISSTMRRRRYNLEEVSVSFDSMGKSHIIVAIDGELLDVEQVIHQLQKLHDVFDVCDVTHEDENLYYAVYVQVEQKSVIETFPEKPVKIVENNNGFKGIFALSLKSAPAFIEFLNKNNYYYIKRVLSLI